MQNKDENVKICIFLQNHNEKIPISENMHIQILDLVPWH